MYTAFQTVVFSCPQALLKPEGEDLVFYHYLSLSHQPAGFTVPPYGQPGVPPPVPGYGQPYAPPPHVPPYPGVAQVRMTLFVQRCS